MKILLPVDGSPLSLEAVHHAVGRLAQRLETDGGQRLAYGLADQGMVIDDQYSLAHESRATWVGGMQEARAMRPATPCDVV